MKKLLGIGILGLALSAPALAADLPMKAAPLAPAPAVAPTWTGLYVGGHIGAGWGTIESDANIAGVLTLPVSSHNTNGMLGGLQAGYNYQMGWAVLGIEGAWSWANVKGSLLGAGWGPHPDHRPHHRARSPCESRRERENLVARPQDLAEAAQ